METKESSLEDLEHQALMLMHQIRIYCQTLRNPENLIKHIEEGANDHRISEEVTEEIHAVLERLSPFYHNQRQQANVVEDELNKLLNKFSLLRSDIGMAFTRMKFDAEELQSQILNYPDVDLQIKRAGEIASAEAERLLKLVLEMDELMKEVEQAKEEYREWEFGFFTSDFFSKKSTDVNAPVIDSEWGVPDKNVESFFENKESPVTNDYRINQPPPALGAVAPSGLDSALKKIPHPVSNKNTSDEHGTPLGAIGDTLESLLIDSVEPDGSDTANLKKSNYSHQS